MIKKIFILGIITLFSSLNAFSSDDISELEYAKYGTNYPYESLSERLNRLEFDYFGMAQSGDLESRLDKLSKINQNSKTASIFTNNDNYFNTKKKSSIRNFWDSITSPFGNNGYITGYTPSINTITTSGYENDIYGNHFNNYMNNPYSFCPYNSQLHNRVPYTGYGYFPNKRNSDYNRFLNHDSRFISHNNKSQRLHHYPYNNNNNFNQPYVNRTTYYLPPDFETKSSIHILKD